MVLCSLAWLCRKPVDDSHMTSDLQLSSHSVYHPLLNIANKLVFSQPNTATRPANVVDMTFRVHTNFPN